MKGYDNRYGLGSHIGLNGSDDIVGRSSGKPQIRNIKSRTYIDVTVRGQILKQGQLVRIFGYLRILESDYGLVNSQISIYLSGKFIKSALTTHNGYFETNFVVNETGKHEITAVYEGDLKYDEACSVKYIDVIPLKAEPQIDNLEKLCSLYERGLLSDEEFGEMKRRLIG